MNDEKHDFRIHVRLVNVEYADLKADLNKYPAGQVRSGRIRLLLRYGLAAVHGILLPLPDESSEKPKAVSPPPLDESQGAPTPAPTTPAVTSAVEADSLDAIMDLNPADFRMPVGR